MLRDAIIRLAYASPDLRPHLLRLLTADAPAGRGREEEPEEETKKKGPPPMWKEFLDAKYEGGKKKVPNTNPDTKDRYDQVSMTTRFKNDKSYQDSVYKEYREWMKKQKGEKKPDSSKSKEPEEPEKSLKEHGEVLAGWKSQKALSVVGEALAKGKEVSTKKLQKAIQVLESGLKGVPASHEGAKPLRAALKALKAQAEKQPKDFKPENSLTPEDVGLLLETWSYYEPDFKPAAKALSEGKPASSDDLQTALASVGEMLDKSDKYDDIDADDLRDAMEVLKSQLEKQKKDEEEAAKAKPKAKPKSKSKKKPEWLPDSEADWDAYGKRYNTARSTWTSDEKYGVSRYTGSAYNAVNKALRNGESLGGYQYVQTALDSIFKDPKKGRVLKDVMVARGAGNSHPLAKMLQAGTLEVGVEIEDKGYVSASIKSWDQHDWGSAVKMNIHVPKGARGIYVGPPPSSYSQHPDEYELLLDRNVKMRVTGFDKSTNSVDLEVIV